METKRKSEKKQLTEKQRKVFEFIKLQIKEKKVPPSIREIGDACGLSSTSSVHLHLETLEKKGYITRQHAKTRYIKVVEEEENEPVKVPECEPIPIIGTVAAGVPILAEENIESYFPVPSSYISGGTNFMLKISGNSMIKAGINDGDLVIVRQQPAAENNEIVIALIDDSATCKRFFKEDDKIRLQPENDSFEPIIVDDVTILGKVVGLFRSI